MVDCCCVVAVEVELLVVDLAGVEEEAVEVDLALVVALGVAAMPSQIVERSTTSSAERSICNSERTVRVGLQ